MVSLEQDCVFAVTDVSCSSPSSLKLPEEQRLLKDDTPLEDAKSLAEYRIENDDVLALTYKLPGKCRRNCSRLPEERSFVLLFLIFRVFLKSTILLTATD